MRTIFWDIETRSVVNLKVSGAHVYATHSTTQPLCLVYAIDFDEPQLWLPGQPVPAIFLEAAADPDSHKLVAHNAAFERAILDNVLVPRHGFQPIPTDRQFCSMALALFNARPAELGRVVESLGLPYPKNPIAKRAMLRLTRPKQQRKRDAGTEPKWHEDPADFALLVERCTTDVKAARALWYSNRLRPLPESERKVWQLDQEVNNHGPRCDRTFVEAARQMAIAERTRINLALADLTGDQITTANQVQRFIKLVNARGHKMSSLSKRSVAAVLAHKPDGFVEQLLRLRQEGARASVRKYDALLAFASPDDDRLRGCYQFYGSHTGRWAGRGPQLQNLKKNAAKLPLSLVDSVRRGDRAELARYGRPLELLGDLSRAAIQAAPGHVLLAGDFSAIESRVCGWLAGEVWKIRAYEEYDRTGDKALEPYCVLAARMLGLNGAVTDEQRQTGKGTELAFSFGGAVGAWRKLFHGDPRTDEELRRLVNQYRAANPATKMFWYALMRSIRTAITNPGQRIPVPNGRRPGEPGPVIEAAFDGDLLLTLPSRRTLIYPEARLVPSKFDDAPADVEYRDNSKGLWRWKRCWHGVFVENVVQSTARDLLVGAMVRLRDRGWKIVTHCHDEIVIEAPIGAISEAEFKAILIEAPAWATGLPLNGKVHSGEHYLEPPETPAVPLAELEPETEPEAVVEAAIDVVVDNEDTGEIDDPDSMEREDDRDYVDNLPDNIAPLYELASIPVTPGHKVSCPFHEPDDDPSCQLYADHFHCHACGAHGDRLKWLKDAEGLTEPEAIATIKAWQDVPADGPRRDIEEDTASKIARALRLWEEAKSIAGSPAAKYLDTTRGVDLTGLPADVYASLRFHPACTFGSDKLPCLIALMRDPTTNESTGIQRIALGLSLDGRVDKVERRMLGRAGVVMLWPAASTLVVGEGLETVLAAATRIPYRGGSLSPAWACLSAHRLGSLPVIPGVERLIVLVDHDEEGRKAADRVGATWRAAGRQVTTLMPPEPGDDFNDFILKMESNNHACVA